MCRRLSLSLLPQQRSISGVVLDDAGALALDRGPQPCPSAIADAARSSAPSVLPSSLRSCEPRRVSSNSSSRMFPKPAIAFSPSVRALITRLMSVERLGIYRGTLVSSGKIAAISSAMRLAIFFIRNAAAQKIYYFYTSLYKHGDLQTIDF
jgi:hypothetical protein